MDLNSSDHKEIEPGLYEMEVDSDISIYFGKWGNKIILLIGGKKTTREQDIEKAQEYWEDWKKRNTKIKEN